MKKTISEKYCLFSNLKLNKNTTIEHTIPASIGGRTKSRDVISSEINNALSKTDAYIAKAYKPYMDLLYFKLPNPAKREKTKREIPNTFLNKNIIVTQSPFSIELIKPIKLFDSSGNVIRKLEPANTIEDISKHTDYQKEPLEKIEIDIIPIDHIIISNNWSDICEFSLLRSGLLTFDHLFQESNETNIIRAENIKKTIECVSSIANILREKNAEEAFQIIGNSLYDIMLGFDLNLLPNIEDIINKSKINIPQYCHYIFIQKNADTRLIHMVFCAFSKEPWVFLIGSDWNGLSEIHVAINPILKETGSSRLETIKTEKLLNFKRKSVCCGFPSEQEEMRERIELLFHYRSRIQWEMQLEHEESFEKTLENIHFSIKIFQEKGRKYNFVNIIKKRMVSFMKHFPKEFKYEIFERVNSLNFDEKDTNNFPYKYKTLIGLLREKSNLLISATRIDLGNKLEFQQRDPNYSNKKQGK